MPGTPAISTNLTPPVPEVVPSDVGETLPAEPEPEPEPPPIPSIAQEPAAPVAQPMHTIEPVALAPVISEPKVEGPAAPLVDTKVTEPAPVLTDWRDDTSAAQVSPQELEVEEMPSRDAEPSHIEPAPEEPATTLAQPQSSAFAPTSAEEIIAPPPEPWSPVAETEEPDRLETTTGPLRRIPRWVWLTGAAAALLLSGIPFLWKNPVGPARPTSSLGNAETHPSSTPFTSTVASPLPTPYVRTDVTEHKETVNVPPVANSPASIAAREAPASPNQPVISGVQETPAASSSSAIITTPQETSSSADQFAVGNAPTRPSPPTAASAAKEVPPTPNPSPRVTAAEAAPPSPIPSATVAAAETVSPPVQATPAASPEAKPKKRETVAKRTERKSTGESPSTRSNAAATPRAASPAPTKKPARKGPAPQPFDGGVPGG